MPVSARLLTVSVALGCTSIEAHHSFAPYDMSRTVELTGVVVEFQFRSPHSMLEMDVVNENGVVERWQIEASSVPLLSRRGIQGDCYRPSRAVISAT